MAVLGGNGVGGEIVSASGDVLKEISTITNWLEALGLVFILWLFFQLITFFINRKRILEVFAIRKDMERIEKKIDKLVDKKRR
jgi:hypothetical protein